MSSSEPHSAPSSRRRDLVRVVVPVLVAVAFGALWQLTPLGDTLPVIRDTIDALQHNPWAPLLVVVLFVAGGLVIAPVSVLLVGTVVVFGPLLGTLYAVAGALSSATVVFFIGQALGRQALERLLGRRAERIAGALHQHGLVAMAVVRNIPVAPYSIVNLVAGASPLRFRDYILGTLLGMTPAFLGLALVGERIVHLIRNPEPSAMLTLAAIVAVVAVVAVVGGRWLARRFGS